MARVAPLVPEETALLCEKCGYIISGIPADSSCPECGQLISQSLPHNRRPPLWENPTRSPLLAFLATTAHVIFRPTNFYRSITARSDNRRALRFARYHYILSSLLFGLAMTIHILWSWEITWSWGRSWSVYNRTILIAAILTYATLILTTSIASRLTAWEAAYRGLRLPRSVVQRALYYHSAHYLPVGLLICATVLAYQYLRQLNPRLASLTEEYAVWYLYFLCGEVVLAAAYLFITYWKSMKNLFFANS